MKRTPPSQPTWGVAPTKKRGGAMLFACWRDRPHGAQVAPDHFAAEPTATMAEHAARAWLKSQGIVDAKRSDRLVTAWMSGWKTPPPDVSPMQDVRDTDAVVHFVNGKRCMHPVTKKTHVSVWYVATCGATDGETERVKRTWFDGEGLFGMGFCRAHSTAEASAQQWDAPRAPRAVDPRFFAGHVRRRHAQRRASRVRCPSDHDGPAHRRRSAWSHRGV